MQVSQSVQVQHRAGAGPILVQNSRRFSTNCSHARPTEEGHSPSNLEKHQLDTQEPNNYRPVSNLPYLSKGIERVVEALLNEHLAAHSLTESVQSAYRQYHSTKLP